MPNQSYIFKQTDDTQQNEIQRIDTKYSIFKNATPSIMALNFDVLSVIMLSVSYAGCLLR